MTTCATAVDLAGGSGHKHITGARWLDSDGSTSHRMSLQGWIDWLMKGYKACVADVGGPVEVRVVDANPRYVRTLKDKTWTDNLLA